FSNSFARRVHRLLDRGEDVGISATPTNVAAHQLANVVGRLGAAFSEQANRGTDLTRSAVPALKGILLKEGLLHGMKRLALSQALDGRDLGTISHDGQRQARVDAL